MTLTALEGALQELRAEGLGCTRCALSSTRTQVVFGVGNPNAGLMFIGEGPGRDEDLRGEPFVGRSGKLLDRLMAEEMGIDRTGCYIANVLMCRPPGNRDPRPEEIESCRPHLEAKIELFEPRVIVTLGNFATRFILDRAEGIKRLRGHVYPYRHGVVVPTYHPSAALRSGGEVVAEMRADLVRAKQALAVAS
ncbi:MAG TPA: uracil-DNA glycosylase [Acidimicrobiales bacterium]|nr:uracil-DNA glycosylase [Acidimicrobiales bacterium]